MSEEATFNLFCNSAPVFWIRILVCLCVGAVAHSEPWSFRRTYCQVFVHFIHLAGLLGQEGGPSEDLCLHRTANYRKTLTNIRASSGILTHEAIFRITKAHAIDRSAPVIDELELFFKMVAHKYIYFQTLMRVQRHVWKAEGICLENRNV